MMFSLSELVVWVGSRFSFSVLLPATTIRLDSSEAGLKKAARLGAALIAPDCDHGVREI